MTVIDISGLDKAKLLQALYSRAKPQGMGFVDYTSDELSDLNALDIIDIFHGNFDYLNGRVMKVDISGDFMRPL